MELAQEKPQPSLCVKDRLVSIVVPVFNEELNIDVFVDTLQGVMSELPCRYEILLVDDGSTDNTWLKICDSAQRNDSKVTGLSLSRNFGHQNALFAGLNQCKGDIIISMDGDLQHPPALIPKLLEAWQQGNKIVTTQRIDAQETSWFKRTTSRWFYRIFSKLSGIEMRPGNSDFRLMDRDALVYLRKIGDSQLFLRGVTAWIGFTSTTIPYEAANRFAGESKYDLIKMIRFSSAAIVSFSIIPLKVGIWVGFFTGFLAIIEIIYIIFSYLSDGTVPGWASVMTFMSIMFSVLFFMVGIIGLYLGGISEMLKKRPRYIIENKILAKNNLNENSK